MEHGHLMFLKGWYDAIETLPEMARYEALEAIIRYAFYGEIPDCGIGRTIVLLLKEEIEELTNGTNE